MICQQREKHNDHRRSDARGTKSTFIIIFIFRSDGQNSDTQKRVGRLELELQYRTSDSAHMTMISAWRTANKQPRTDERRIVMHRK